MSKYPLGDFLSQIKNAYLARHKEVSVPNTKLIHAVSKALEKEGYFDEVKEKDGLLNIKLTYRKKEPLLSQVKLISKPGLRIYMSADELESIQGPYLFIISTSKGVMTSREAFDNRIGGEVLAKIL